ncbi:hypothetical protein D3C80_1499390 [compost metagenome]
MAVLQIFQIALSARPVLQRLLIVLFALLQGSLTLQPLLAAEHSALELLFNIAQLQVHFSFVLTMTPHMCSGGTPFFRRQRRRFNLSGRAKRRRLQALLPAGHSLSVVLVS